GAAAVLLSNNAYALHLPRTHLGVRGSEKAILAEGKVEVDGHIVVKNAGSISVALPKASNEAFVDGDLITIDNGVASKMRQENQPLVGVVSKEAALQLESGQGALKVAVAGVVSLRVHGQVKAGDKLALNTAQAGTCKVGQGQEKFFAVALEASTNDREKSVLAILVR
ncbi:MAG TPA: coagulation factor 5/8 type domain protein, partial [Turneriella sp.]|nr:coagulation factor 5/8 type domain protein [Turneriella sp.]